MMTGGCECSIAQPAPLQPADQTGLKHFHRRTKKVVFQKRLKNPVQKAKTRDTEQEIQLVVVDVKGEVERPGLTHLSSRVASMMRLLHWWFYSRRNQKSVNLAQNWQMKRFYVAHKDEDISVITAPNSSVVATQTQEESQSLWSI